jgi:hypothetical protein
MSSHPPSPGARASPPPDAEEEDSLNNLDAEGVAASPRASPKAVPEKSTKYENRPFLLFFSKKYYRVPKEHVVFDMGRPFVAKSAEDAKKLHECKSHPFWLSTGVHSRHIVKLKLELDGKTLSGLYISYKIGDEESDDIYVIRALTKVIAKKFYDMWTGPEEKGGWTEEKRSANKWTELIADEPRDEAQISPERARYEVVPDPVNVLFARVKKLKISDAAPKAASKKSKVAPQADEEDDDAQSSAAQSSALVPFQPPAAAAMAGSGGGGMTFFMHTPGQVTISEAYLQHLIANQR